MRAGRKKVKIIYLYLLLLVLAGVSLCLGRYSIDIKDIFSAVFAKGYAKENLSVVHNIIYKVRLPRIMASVLLGSALSAAGASYQGIFKNPMVSPSLLGVSSGSGVGAGVAILLGLGAGAIQGMAFVFGLSAVAIVYVVSRLVSKGMDRTLTLILTGVVISSAFTSILSLLKYIGDPYNDLPAITFWLLGSVADVKMDDLIYVAVPVVAGIIGLVLLRWKINIMTLDEEEAASLGIETSKLNGVIILLSTVITASVVSISGMISWVGLVVPHIGRMIVGNDYRRLMPAAIALGGIFMLVLDSISRVVFPSEIPLGILTSLVGTPFFLYLMIKGKRSW